MESVMPKSIWISLQEPQQLVVQTFRDISTNALVRWTGKGPAPYSTFQTDGVEVMLAIVDEIFQKNRPDGSLGNVARSTAVLINMGMSPQAAGLLSSEVYKSTLDQIVSCLPEVTFEELSDWQYGYSEHATLIVTPPL
jgi:hypothetical protein